MIPAGTPWAASPTWGLHTSFRISGFVQEGGLLLIWMKGLLSYFHFPSCACLSIPLSQP